MALAICAMALEMSNFNANVTMGTLTGQMSAKVKHIL
jgi:hypothetical protein